MGNKKQYIKPEVSREELEEQLYRISMDLWAANERLKQEEKTRTEMFCNLSHDLRAPVSALLGAIEYMQSYDLDKEEQKKMLDVMYKRINYLKRMIEDMFLLSKMENPETHLNKETISLKYLLEEYYLNLEMDDKFNNRQLSMDITEDICNIEADPELIVRVLDNLVTNAYKYSDSGDMIKLTLKVEDGYILTVEDTGSGIDKADIDHIFERTYRGSKSRNPEDGSSGLGLSIVLGIVKRHGGSIKCESELNKYTKMIISFPKNS